MNWKPFYLLLSASVAIVSFNPQYKVLANETFEITTTKIQYGYFRFTEPSISVTSYARSRKSNALFAVAINSGNQVIDDSNGLEVPTPMLVDCQEGRGELFFMEKQPSNITREQGLGLMRAEIVKFCNTHKRIWKHSDW
jgi:hypothetical protein